MANCQIGPKMWRFERADSIAAMRDFLILFVHLIVTVARLAGPGGLRFVVAESVLVRQQLLVPQSRAQPCAQIVRTTDRIITGLCTLFIRPGRVLRFRYCSETFLTVVRQYSIRS